MTTDWLVVGAGFTGATLVLSQALVSPPIGDGRLITQRVEDGMLKG